MAYGYLDIDTRRNVEVGAIKDDHQNSYHANLVQGFVEGSHTWQINDTASLMPYVNVAHVYLNTDSVNEGNKVSSLQVNGQNQEMTYATLGARAKLSLDAAKQYTLYADLAWQHAFGNTPESTMRFKNGGNDFHIQGVPVDGDSALVGFGIKMNLNKAATLSVGYQGEFGDNLTDHSANIRFNYLF